MSLASHIAALKVSLAKDPNADLLDLAMLNIMEELAEQLAQLAAELVRHATDQHDPRRRT
jgi:hypothetical protein